MGQPSVVEGASEGVDGGRPHVEDNKSLYDNVAVAKHVVCRVDQLVEGRGRPARVRGTYLAVFLAKGEIAVVENQCTHVGSPLDGGAVVDQRVHCPWHGWAYDLRSGNLLTAFGERPGIRVFHHEVVEGEVIVDLEDDLRD